MASLTEILPLDVIIDIVDKVASCDDDHGSSTNVKACSLISKLFVPHCRKLIFHSITIDMESGRTSRLFGSLVESAPWVTDYVQVLEITPIINHYDVSIEEESTLRRLKKLHTLILKPGTIFGLDWRRLCPNTLSLFVHLMQLPTIVNLKFMTFRYFNSFFLIPCIGLKHLYIHNSDLIYIDRVIQSTQHQDESPNNLSSHPVPPLLLDGIDIDSYTAQTLEVMVKPIMDLGMLKSIRIRINSTHRGTESALQLFHYTKNLKTIHFKLGRISDAAVIVPSLLASGYLNTLNTLRISLDFEEVNVVPPICEVLQKLAGRNQITTLILAFVIMATSKPSESDEWNPLENTLLSDGWPLLRRFDLIIHILTWENVHPQLELTVFEDAFKRQHETQLAKLAKTTSFEYNFTITRGPWSVDM